MEILAYGFLLIGALGLIALRGYITENPDFLKDHMSEKTLAKIEDFFRPPSVLDDQRGAIVENPNTPENDTAAEDTEPSALDDALNAAEERLKNSPGAGVSADTTTDAEKKVV